MWKDLTLKEKAEIMKMSVANGVTDINDIQQLYDGSTEHLYKNAGPLDKAKQQPKYQYGIIEQILRENGVNFRVTSGARKPNQAGNAGKSSAHTYTIFGNSPGAIDIVPGVGSDWDTLFAQMNNPKVRRALAVYGLDVLNETNPSVMRSTHATGPHLHVGRGIKGQSGAGQMFGGTSYGGGKGDVYQASGRNTNYSSLDYDINPQLSQPITLGANPQQISAWNNYLTSLSKQSPITFNTPIGATNTQQNNVGINLTPTDFSVLSGNGDLMSPLEPYAAKQAIEYGLGLENNALWNSPYLMFDSNYAANGGHLFGDGSMLLKGNAVNPALQYVYGPNYEEIVRTRRNYRPTGNIHRSRPVYDIKQQTDVVANTTRPTQRKIKIAKEVESPARRKKEEEKATNRHLQYIRERQGSIQPQPNTLHHPDYNPKFAQEVEELRRKEAKEALEREPVDTFVGNVLEGVGAAVPWPSTIVGSLTHPDTHGPFSFFSNLYAKDNRGFFNFNQATRDFYDANPEVGGAVNLIGDFIAPGAASKVLKGASRASKFAAADIGNSWKTMRYELAHPEAQTLGIIPDGFNVSKLNNKLKNFNNKLDDTMLKIGNAEMQVVDNIKHGVSGIRDRIHSIVNRSERPILERTRDYGALSDTQLNSIPYIEALKYPDFVDYAFVNSGSLHPNFPAGSTRKDIMDAMANVERNLASRPRFATSEFLGQDFSGQSVQMILNRIDKLQKQLIKSGEQPGIIRYTPDARTYLNPYAEINYGTKEAPTNPFTTMRPSGNYQLPYTRLDQEYTIEDMSKWSDIQATLDAITKRLQRVYDNVSPYNEAVRNAGRDAFKAEVLPNGYITVPSIGFLFRNGGKL